MKTTTVSDDERSKFVCAYSHGRGEATEDVTEAAGLAPGGHLGADEHDVHAGAGGVHDDGGEPPAATLHRPLLLGRRARAGRHAERRRVAAGGAAGLEALEPVGLRPWNPWRSSDDGADLSAMPKPVAEVASWDVVRADMVVV